MPWYAGFDTSNYKTSASLYDSDNDKMYPTGAFLPVPQGNRGLRQNDALFLHTRALPSLYEQLCSNAHPESLAAVGASTQPRNTKDSYMPCFLAGAAAGRVIAATISVPFYGFSHQQGHIAAAAWSAKRPDLLNTEFLAWHLSGGTTELLRIFPDPSDLFDCEICLATEDLSAGQVIDRAGVMLGLPFPSGAALEKASGEDDGKIAAKTCFKNGRIHFSGLENQFNKLRQDGESAENIAGFVLRSVCETVRAATAAAVKDHGGLPVLCAGGVMSNKMIRTVLTEEFHAITAAPEYSGDNASGAALLACLAHREKLNA